MSVCLPFDALITVSEVQLNTLATVGNQLDARNTQSNFVFSHMVEALQAVLRHTYGAAARAARDADEPSEAAHIWESMGAFADGILDKLVLLKEIFADCGTPALYDLALDYKLASQRRCTDNQEQAACLNENRIPAGLFPATI